MLLILLASSAGVFIICKVQQCMVQHEMAEAFADGKASFLTIKLTMADFKKSKLNNHEMVVDGKMYDIRNATICHDTVELVVAHDAKEENILNKLSNTIQKSEKKNNSLSADFIKLLSVVYISPASQASFTVVWQPVMHFITENENVVYRTGDTLSPPPKFIFTLSFIA